MSRSITRRLARAAVVTAAVLTAGLAGMSPAHADPPSQESEVAEVAEDPDLVVFGRIDVFSLGEIGGAAIRANIENISGGSSPATVVRFTLVRVTRITAGGQTRHVNLPNSPTVRVTDEIPAIAGGGVTEAVAVIPNAQYRPGLTRITACVDPDNTIREYSDTNNCRSEIRTI